MPGFPVEALNAVNALLLGYIAQVAAWCGRPSWAEVHVRLGAARRGRAYAALAEPSTCWLVRRRRGGWRRCGRAERAGASASPAGRPGSAPLASARLACAVAAQSFGGRGGASGPAARPPGRGARRRPGRLDPAAAARRRPGAGRRRPARRRPARAARRPRRRLAGRRDRHPRPVRPRRRPRRAARADAGRRARLRRGWADLLGAGAGVGRRDPARRRGRRAALRRACASTSSGRRANCSPGLRPLRARPEPAWAAWSSSPAGATSRSCSPPTPRRRRCRSTPARRRAQGRPPRQRRRRPRRPARPHRSRAGGDLGRRRQPLRPPDRRAPWRRSPRTACGPCAPISSAARSRSTPGPPDGASLPARKLLRMPDEMKPAYLIGGDDEAKIAATRRRLRERAEREGGAAALESFAGEGRAAPDADALVRSIAAMSLVVSRRYLLVDGVEAWGKAQASRVAEALAAIPEQTTVVLISRGKTPAGLAKEVEKAGGEVISYEAPKAREIPSTLVADGKRRGLSLAPDAARLLVDRLGRSPLRLGNELDRLALWAGDGGLGLARRPRGDDRRHLRGRGLVARRLGGRGRHRGRAGDRRAADRARGERHRPPPTASPRGCAKAGAPPPVLESGARPRNRSPTGSRCTPTRRRCWSSGSAASSPAAARRGRCAGRPRGLVPRRRRLQRRRGAHPGAAWAAASPERTKQAKEKRGSPHMTERPHRIRWVRQSAYAAACAQLLPSCAPRCSVGLRPCGRPCRFLEMSCRCSPRRARRCRPSAALLEAAELGLDGAQRAPVLRALALAA